MNSTSKSQIYFPSLNSSTIDSLSPSPLWSLPYFHIYNFYWHPSFSPVLCWITASGHRSTLQINAIHKGIGRKMANICKVICLFFIHHRFYKADLIYPLWFVTGLLKSHLPFVSWGPKDQGVVKVPELVTGWISPCWWITSGPCQQHSFQLRHLALPGCVINRKCVFSDELHDNLRSRKCICRSGRKYLTSLSYSHWA